MAPTLSWAALDLGSVRARLKASKARADGALAAYELAVLRADQRPELSGDGDGLAVLAVRSLARQRSFTLAALATLAIGIAATTAGAPPMTAKSGNCPRTRLCDSTRQPRPSVVLASMTLCGPMKE